MVVGFTRARPGGGRVYTVSLGSLARALGIVGFIRSLWVHSGAPWGSIGSSGVVGLTQVRLWSRGVHPE